MTMPRDEVLKALIPYLTDRDIVVAVYQTNFDWMAINPRDLNYVAVGAMGQASSHGLGLALANPDRRVIVLDGDGSLLMNLGALVTNAAASAANLHHFVFVNRVYEVNGNHPLPGAGAVDFAGIAKAAGYRKCQTCNKSEELSHIYSTSFAEAGPTFTALEVVAGKVHPRDYDFIHSSAARDRFRRALNAP